MGASTFEYETRPWRGSLPEDFDTSAAHCSGLGSGWSGIQPGSTLHCGKDMAKCPGSPGAELLPDAAPLGGQDTLRAREMIHLISVVEQGGRRASQAASIALALAREMLLIPCQGRSLLQLGRARARPAHPRVQGQAGALERGYPAPAGVSRGHL